MKTTLAKHLIVAAKIEVLNEVLDNFERYDKLTSPEDFNEYISSLIREKIKIQNDLIAEDNMVDGYHLYASI